jgi:glycosyltransferase involved in cell wall biosynthesis
MTCLDIDEHLRLKSRWQTKGPEDFMAERIVVMFAYHFPPENTAGAARPYHFYKYLSRMGYRCHVVTAAAQGTIPETESECVADPFVTHPRQGIGWQFERAVRKLLIPAVTGLRWSRLACRAARAFLMSRPSAEITIYSTYPPLGAHLAALLLIRKSALKWIADYRDPLSDNPANIGLTRFQQELYRWMERFILRRADVIITNTDVAAEKLRNAYPKYQTRVHVIWNGFDPEDRIEQRPLSPRTYRLFTHTGELYGGRNITPLLKSVSRLIDAGRLMTSSIRIRLVGPFESISVPELAFLMRAKQQGWLELDPEQVPRHEARRIAQDSDGLLLIQPHSAVQVPAKLFEYLRLGRPILAFILPNSPIERILSHSGVTYRCVYAGSSVQETDSAVQSFLDLKWEAAQANAWFGENFDAQKQTQSLGALIGSIHGR